MADDNHANSAKIGLTVLLGVAAIIGTLVYLGGAGNREKLLYAETYYLKSVSGLSVGSPVNFRGVKLGEVCEIDFVGNHYPVTGDTNQLIYVRIAFEPQRMGIYEDEGYDVGQAIRRMVEHYGLRATVTASGITGLSRIECDFRPDLPPPPPITWKPEFTYIPPAVSLLDSFSDSATKVMNQINRMDIQAAWSNIASTVESLSRTTDGARIMMESHLGEFEALMNDVSASAASLRELTDKVKRNPSLLLRESEPVPLDETR